MKVWLYSMLYFGLDQTIKTAPVYNSRELDLDEFFTKYGYIHETEDVSAQETQRSNAVKLYQKYYGLKTTGVVDDVTYNLMMSSRCGVADNPDTASENTIVTVSPYPTPIAYKLSGPKWQHKTVKWGISSYTSQLDRQIQKKTFSDALYRWQEVSGLQFVYTDSDSDIDIRFVSRDHGDGSAFDGPSTNRKGNVLAHAFPPGSGGLSGDAHFDNDEKWTVDIKNKIWEQKSLEKVAAHEFGHSLGLQHSSVKGALMNAYYSGSNPTYEITFDDLSAIQALYGKPDGWRPTLGGYVPTPAPQVPTCNSLFKAIVWGSDQKAYGIYMDQVISINDGRQSLTLPKLLQEVFPGAPIEVDFAFTMNKISRRRTTSTVTYMFFERTYWRFSSYTLDRGYPKTFNVGGFPEQPKSVVATTEEGRESIFMIGKTKWWVWDESNQETNTEVISESFQGYWSHSPGDYPLVTTWIDGDVYLISNNNHVRLKARNARDGYPKKGVPDWIYKSCPGGASRHLLSLTLMWTVLLSTAMYT